MGRSEGFHRLLSARFFNNGSESVHFQGSVVIKDGKFKFTETIDGPRSTMLRIKVCREGVFLVSENTQNNSYKSTMTVLKKAIES